MEILRETGYVAVPWKNGGGITREILREPQAPALFDWRLSLATIEAPGPFSAFDGYDRTLILVRGGGVELTFDEGKGHAVLRAPGELARFDGGWRTHCALLAGPCADLNLIVSRTLRSTSRIVTVEQPAITPTAGWSSTLVCCVEGSVRLTNSTGESAELSPVDVARCAPPDGLLTCEPSQGRALVFIAHLVGER